MLNISRIASLGLALAPCLVGSSLLAQQPVPQANSPKAPIGYILIDEEQWNSLADEPGRHIGRARDAYLMMDARDAAIELRKAAVHVRVAAEHATERTNRALVKSEHELEHVARQAEAGTFKSMEEFDAITTRALHALANDQYVKASEAWRKRELRMAGLYLRASADNMERAAARAEASVRQSTATLAKDTRRISGKLVEGTGFVIDEVGSGFEAVGGAIERFGLRFEGTARK